MAWGLMGKRGGGHLVRWALPLVLTVVAALSGCALLSEPPPRDVAGPTDGYQPTASYLKVFVKGDGGSLTLIDFDRRDWHAAGIVKALDDRTIRFVVVHGQEKGVLNEIVVEVAKSPPALAALKYDEMHATAEQRAAMDLEYEQLLQRIAQQPPPTITSPPVLTLP